MWSSVVVCMVGSCVVCGICGISDLRGGGVPGVVFGLCLSRM